MASTKERLSAQVSTESLTAVQDEARARGCDVGSVLEDALRFYFEAATQTRSRPEVMAHYQASVERHGKLYELLAQ